MQSKFFWYLLMMSLPVWFELISAPFPNTGFSSQGRQLFSCLDIWSPTNIPPRHCPIRVAQVLSMSTSQDHFSGISSVLSVKIVLLNLSKFQSINSHPHFTSFNISNVHFLWFYQYYSLKPNFGDFHVDCWVYLKKGCCPSITYAKQTL